MQTSLSAYEKKVWSQHGEDGILQALIGSLRKCNKVCLEIGASWQECNTRYLLENGWTGKIVDVKPDDSRISEQWVTPRTVTFDNPAPDVFSLDIDSYDYFVADAMLRKGFRPKIVCVETNTFITGARTVEYHESHSRYELQPRFGLYFGCSLEAWRWLWEGYSYRYVGMDASFTNAFFVRTDCSDWPMSTEYVGYQAYFCRKYSRSGEELSATLEGLPFLEVTTRAYDHAFHRSTAKRHGIELVTTYTRDGWERHAKRFVDTFIKHWPPSVRLTCFAEPYMETVDPGALNVMELDLMLHSPAGLRYKLDAASAHRGMVNGTYNYIYDAVRWSHRIFALAAAARRSTAEIMINIDSDILTFADVDEDWIRGLLGDADIAYMPRQGMYSECSFVIYRMENPRVREFIAEHEKFYTTGLIYKLNGWTDCHAFDKLVTVYPELKYKDINKGIPASMHPFVNGPLGSRLDHLKGGRKKDGKSRKTDLVVERTETYWS